MLHNFSLIQTKEVEPRLAREFIGWSHRSMPVDSNKVAVRQDMLNGDHWWRVERTEELDEIDKGLASIDDVWVVLNVNLGKELIHQAGISLCEDLIVNLPHDCFIPFFLSAVASTENTRALDPGASGFRVLLSCN